MSVVTTGHAGLEDLESFRARARAFVRANLRPVDPNQMIGPLRNERTDEEELAAVAREREVQRMLFDAGLAGICFPKEYGGQGLDPRPPAGPQRRSWPATSIPARLQAPTFSPVRRRPPRLRHRGAEARPTSRPS